MLWKRPRKDKRVYAPDIHLHSNPRLDCWQAHAGGSRKLSMAVGADVHILVRKPVVKSRSSLKPRANQAA